MVPNSHNKALEITFSMSNYNSINESQNIASVVEVDPFDVQFAHVKIGLVLREGPPIYY